MTVEEAKRQLSLLDSDSDDFIARLIAVATEVAERYTGRALITQTWRATWDEFPCSLIGPDFVGRTYSRPGDYSAWELRLPRPPLILVTGIVYVDDTGADQTLGTNVYVVTAGAEPATIAPAYGQVWPAARCQSESVRVTYTAGYGADSTSVPEPIRHAILLMVAQWFRNREAVTDAKLAVAPQNAEWLLDGYKTGASAEWFHLVS